jgi:hypothetical protein
MSTSLRSHLSDLASSFAQSFADSVLAAIRTASLEDLVMESDGARNGRTRTRGGGTTAGNPGPRSKRTTGGRLARRSAEDIAKTLAKVVSAVKAAKGKGMRAEQIKAALKLDRRELPRVLHEGLRTKKLKSKGQKRATVYFTR